MIPYYQDELTTLYCGDCRDVVLQLKDCTAVVSDPPYGLEFMSKDWDRGIPGARFWELIAIACLPGAPLLAFGGTRTFHRLVCAIEDGGWEIRDSLMWLHAQGFPKALDISKSIDKAAGEEREVVGKGTKGSGQNLIKLQNHGPGDTGIGYMDGSDKVFDITVPATELAKIWDGYGTALKPAYEPICLAMKPMQASYAENAAEHGVAGLNIEGCKVGTEVLPAAVGGRHTNLFQAAEGGKTPERQGRWPANILHDGSPEVLIWFPPYTSRFFYCAKSDRLERDSGCEKIQHGGERPARNIHPTVKPVDLMNYLIKLVTMPKRNLILDPFMGSGSTGIACRKVGIPFIGIDFSPEYCEIAKHRIISITKSQLMFF